MASYNFADGPEFKNEPRHVSVDAGQRAELVCEADGNPTAEITWSRKGKFQVLHSSSTYVIPRVQEGMFGVYTCTATVLGFNQIMRDIYLTENGMLIFLYLYLNFISNNSGFSLRRDSQPGYELTYAMRFHK